MADRAHNPLKTTPEERRAEKLQRSRVGWVPKEGIDHPSGAIQNLPAGQESKPASEAPAKAQSRDELPGILLQTPPAPVSESQESHDEAEPVQSELEKVKGRLQKLEQERIAESNAARRQLEFAEEKIFGLAKDLSAAIEANQAFGSPHRLRGVDIWLVLGTAVAAAIVCAFLLAQARRQEAAAVLAADRTSSSNSSILRHSNPNAWQREVGLWEDSGKLDTAANLLDRLNLTLSRIPRTEIARVLHAANLWLKASGAPPCTTTWVSGEESLLVTVRSHGNEPLAAALMRCATAVEHVVP